MSSPLSRKAAPRETAFRVKSFLLILFFFKRKECRPSLPGLQGAVEAVGDGALEDGGGVSVEGLQAGGGHTGVDLAGHAQVHVEDELDLRVPGGVGGLGLDHAGAGVDFGPAGAVQQQLHVHGALGGPALVRVLLRQRAQVGGGDQIPPRLPLQVQDLAGEDVHIPQADALKEGGLVDADELGQGQIQLLAEGLPAGVGHGGQGDEILGQIQLPLAVGGDEVVVGHRLGLLQPGVGGAQAGDLGGGLLLSGGVPGEHGPDGLLEIGGLFGPDGQYGGEAELADDLRQLGTVVVDPGGVGV